MGSLWVRIALVGALSIVLTVVLFMAVQTYYFTRAFNQTSPIFQQALTETINNPELSADEQFEVLRVATREVTDDPEEFRQYMTQLMNVLDVRQRLPRIAARISMPVSLIFALLLAWYIARPIRGVTQAANQISQGNLNARAPVSRGAWLAPSELTGLTRDFNTMATTLERLETERKNMIADIAHELRTPLTVMQGQIDAMTEGVRPLSHESLAKLNRQTQLLSRLVQDLRTLSLAEAGRLSLELQRVDLARLAKSVTTGFEVTAAEKHIRLTFENNLTHEVVLSADPDRLEQVLACLLDNALRYTPSGGFIEVELNIKSEQTFLSVRDSGPGLSEDALEHVFDRFYRSSTAREQVLGGSGLGLAIAKALVEAHGGEVRAANHPGGGAVFTLALPHSTQP